MGDNDLDVDPNVEFLYRTMLQRDPRKRRVKPVQKHLIQVDFGDGEDSEDDSDFDVKKHHEGSDDSEDNQDEDDVDNKESDDENSAESDGSDAGSNSDAHDEESASSTALKIDNDKNDLESSTNMDSMEPTPIKHKHIRVTICCVCLGDISEEDDEIVECDNCGVCVHEGCYGISENHSNASTESSASTEPWFCDACKAGFKPMCELCPNQGGIFKETDAGKWVHLVCALYTPGVAFGDVDKLSPVTLFEMPYSRWGARECSLCEDARFSRTGVCISCDAGMCRTYFHVTCAQREGLLSEAAPDECLDIADPFFAYCKMHADKTMSRAKRRNWLAIQSYIRKHSEKTLEDEEEKSRFERKLNRHRQKYLKARAVRPPSWVPTQKLVRFLTSSPSCVKKMLRKAELMGIITQSHHTTEERQDSRKKSSIAPALSVEFISYYLERNSKVESTKISMKDIVRQNHTLQEQEKSLRNIYDKLFVEMEKLKEENNKLKLEGETLYKTVSNLKGEAIPLPEVLKKKSPVPSVNRMDSVPKRQPSIINQCSVCKKTNDPHLIVTCDLCKKHYHLSCLEPPLTRMPKKSKSFGWQCSQCDQTSSEEDETAPEDLHAPRKLREKIKEPLKWSPDIKYEFEKLTKYNCKPKKLKKKKKKVKKEEEEEDSTQGLLEKMDDTLEEGISAAKKMKIKESCCAVCNITGDSNRMVQCDECQLSYHFGCLDPPSKKTPKQRGYSWHCEACDQLEDSDEDMEEDHGDDE